MVEALKSSGDPPSCTITSTLCKVAELFSYSVNELKAHQTEENMKNVMENFDRVNTVMRVMKLAYPQYLSFQNIMTATTTDLATPSLKNESNDVMASTTTTTTSTNLATVKPIVTPSANLAAPVEVKPEPNHANPYRDHSPVAVPMAAPPAPTTKINLVPQFNTQVESTQQAHISPKEFLDKFEKTCKQFAAENGFIVANIWESLLVHALPKDKLAWAEKNILNRNLSWYEARQIYLRSFPISTSPTPPQQSKPQQIQPQQSVKQQAPPPVRRETARMTRTLNPLPTPPPMDDEEAKLLRKKQEKYAEFFLALQMREYETIGDYNRKFLRYVNIANIGLSQADLIRRYLNSLLKEHKEMMDAALTSHPSISRTPTQIEDMMALTEKVITSQQKVKDRIYAQACWQTPRKRENSEIQLQQQQQPPPKRFSPFCA